MKTLIQTVSCLAYLLFVFAVWAAYPAQLLNKVGLTGLAIILLVAALGFAELFDPKLKRNTSNSDGE